MSRIHSAARTIKLFGISGTASIDVWRPGVNSMSRMSPSEIVWKTVRSSWKPSGRRFRTLSPRLSLASARTRARLVFWSMSVMEEREDIVAFEFLPATQEIEFDDELQTGDLTPEF